jgi:hypothetical protein
LGGGANIPTTQNEKCPDVLAVADQADTMDLSPLQES